MIFEETTLKGCAASLEALEPLIKEAKNNSQYSDFARLQLATFYTHRRLLLKFVEKHKKKKGLHTNDLQNQ